VLKGRRESDQFGAGISYTPNMTRQSHALPFVSLLLTSVFMTSCSRDEPHSLVTIADARTQKAIVTDIGEPGDSPGDILTFDQPLLDAGGTRIGNNSGACIRTRTGHSFQCQWTLMLNNGSIQVAGREFDEGASLIAIIGGTGKYVGITGEMESVNNGDGTFRQTLTYRIRPML